VVYSRFPGSPCNPFVSFIGADARGRFNSVTYEFKWHPESSPIVPIILEFMLYFWLPRTENSTTERLTIGEMSRRSSSVVSAADAIAAVFGVLHSQLDHKIAFPGCKYHTRRVASLIWERRENSSVSHLTSPICPDRLASSQIRDGTARHNAEIKNAPDAIRFNELDDSLHWDNWAEIPNLVDLRS